MRKPGLGPDAERPSRAGLSTPGGEREREYDGAHPLKDASLNDRMIVSAVRHLPYYRQAADVV